MKGENTIMLSNSAKQLLDHFKDIYYKTGRTEFIVEDYMNIPGHEAALIELYSEGCISEEKNNVLGSVFLYTDEI
jgi:hypothetical protein